MRVRDAALKRRSRHRARAVRGRALTGRRTPHSPICPAVTCSRPIITYLTGEPVEVFWGNGKYEDHQPA
jgi:hypothetical protein